MRALLASVQADLARLRDLHAPAAPSPAPALCALYEALCAAERAAPAAPLGADRLCANARVTDAELAFTTARAGRLLHVTLDAALRVTATRPHLPDAAGRPIAAPDDIAAVLWPLLEKQKTQLTE